MKPEPTIIQYQDTIGREWRIRAVKLDRRTSMSVRCLSDESLSFTLRSPSGLEDAIAWAQETVEEVFCDR